MAAMAPEIARILAEVSEAAPSWRIVSRDKSVLIYPDDPDRDPITVRPNSRQATTIRNLEAAIRRAGLHDFRRAGLADTATEDAPEPIRVVDSSPHGQGLDGVEDLLMSDGTIRYGCADTSCAQLRFSTVEEAAAHRLAHPEPTSREIAARDLGKALTLLESVRTALAAPDTQAARVAALEADLTAATTRIAALEDELTAVRRDAEEARAERDAEKTRADDAETRAAEVESVLAPLRSFLGKTA